MTHVRACPVCGVIVEWARTTPVLKDGKRIGWNVKLTCSEHGDFDNISGKMNEAWKRVERGMVGAE